MSELRFEEKVINGRDFRVELRTKTQKDWIVITVSKDKYRKWLGESPVKKPCFSITTCGGRTWFVEGEMEQILKEVERVKKRYF